MQCAGFGCGLPLGMFDTLGMPLTDITLDPPVPAPAITAFVEPFMDPFAAAFLSRLASGLLNRFDRVVLMRDSPGAAFAFHYACKFDDLGLLPRDAPKLHLCNLIQARDAAAAAFNRTELARLPMPGTPSDPPTKPGRSAAFRQIADLQCAGALSGAGAFRLRAQVAGGETPALGADRPPNQGSAPAGPRLALLGAPLGSDGLHRRLDTIGALILDQQALTVPTGDRLEDWTANRFAPRQTDCAYLDAVTEALSAAAIDHVIWQRDPHDDLWGWDTPEMKRRVTAAGLGWTDLGALPRWPQDSDLDALPPIGAQP
ncbi:MAG: hypothetical protein ACK5IB_09185 [Qingshengfaniella sp.]